jgi:hypothetical protein
MKEKWERLQHELGTYLFDKTCEFCADNLEDQENISDLINLIISSHVSSLANHLGILAESYKNETYTDEVKTFTRNLLNYLMNDRNITEMRINGERIQ